MIVAKRFWFTQSVASIQYLPGQEPGKSLHHTDVLRLVFFYAFKTFPGSTCWCLC